MRKIDWKPVKDIAELLCGVACYGLVVAASQKFADHITDNHVSRVGYNEAVKAIMDSGMFSHEKTRSC